MTYVFDNAWESERDRLRALEELWDPGTIRHLEALGIEEGFRCIELGGGGGSIGEWLSKAVGEGGRVLATDIDTRFLDVLQIDNLEVLNHDISKDPLPWDSVDFIHSRAVVEHLPNKQVVLNRMIDALKPGGWLLIEDFDWLSASYPVHDSKTFFKVTDAIFTLMEAAGYDKGYGRRLPADLQELGLTDIGGEGRCVYVRGGSRHVAFFSLALQRFRDGLVGSGLLTDEDIATALEEMSDPTTASVTPVVLSVWARKP